MGRGAKYFTLEEKRAAKRLQAAAYRNSEKGKRTKAEANRRLYQQNHGGSARPSTSGHIAAAAVALPSSSDQPAVATDTVRPAPAAARPPSPEIPLLDSFLPGELLCAPGAIVPLLEIPCDLTARAGKVLRASFGSVHGSGPLLGLWTPPYRFAAADDDVTVYLDYLPWDGARVQRAAILGAFQCREVLAAARARRGRWRDTAEEELEVEVGSEIAARVDAWRALRDSIVGRDSSEDEELALDWGAKILHMLAGEWECRKHGVDMYMERMQARAMPWQRMVAEMMALPSVDT